jgi:YD repeat-containing protein
MTEETTLSPAALGSEMRKHFFAKVLFVFFIAVNCLVSSVFVLAQTSTGPKTLRYQYDALGRLTFTEDSVNGNRDFDYDKAGNRLFVATGTPSDDAAGPSTPPPPAKPTGLNAYRFADCVYKATWNAVPGATSYDVFDTRGNKQTTSGLSVDVPCTLGQPESNKPNRVYACNSYGCSEKAYFF